MRRQGLRRRRSATIIPWRRNGEDVAVQLERPVADSIVRSARSGKANAIALGAPTGQLPSTIRVTGSWPWSGERRHNRIDPLDRLSVGLEADVTKPEFEFF